MSTPGRVSSTATTVPYNDRHGLAEMSIYGAPGFLTPYHQSHSYTGSPKDRPSRQSPKDRTDTTTTTNNGPDSSSPADAASLRTQGRPSQGRKRLVFADPVAFRYLEEDPATDAIERWRRLQGYEMYHRGVDIDCKWVYRWNYDLIAK